MKPERIPAVLAKIEEEIRKNVDIATIGVSGGADSTLVTIICMRALGPDNVYVQHMPYDNYDISDGRFNMRSLVLTEYLGIKHSKLTWIGDTCEAMFAQFDRPGHRQTSELNKGNTRSRMRMVALYLYNQHISEEFQGEKRCRVMGTGNISEDFIGYDTKGGDALCDLFPIGSLFKSEVYQLLDYFVKQGYINEQHIDRIPSAGLWEGQTDEDEIGFTYNEMEPYIRHYLTTGEWDESTPCGKEVKRRHYINAHKHQAPAVIEIRDFIDK